jgi:hypothetical protein
MRACVRACERACERASVRALIRQVRFVSVYLHGKGLGIGVQ